MKRKNSNENEIFYIMQRQLYSSVIGDIMDKHGYTLQFLPSSIRH
jgi:hypothetical protein